MSNLNCQVNHAHLISTLGWHKKFKLLNSLFELNDTFHIIGEPIETIFDRYGIDQELLKNKKFITCNTEDMKGYNLEIHPLFWAQEVYSNELFYSPGLKKKKFISMMNVKTYTRTALSNILLKYENASYYNYFGKYNLENIDIDWNKSRAYPVEYTYVDWEFGVETGGYNKKYDMYKCITEKTWRPLKLGKPFLVFGYPGMYERLKKYGFILSKDIDYSFDKNNENRFDLFCKEVERLINLNDIENIKQDALANQNIFTNLVQQLYLFPKRKPLRLNQDLIDFILIHKEKLLK